MDVFIGAPLFMDRASEGKLREVGQVGTHRASVVHMCIHTYTVKVFDRLGELCLLCFLLKKANIFGWKLINFVRNN